jgi:hypothetical protein
MSSSFPVKTLEFSVPIQGTATNFFLSAYADRIMVVATQLGTLGTVQLAR